MKKKLFAAFVILAIFITGAALIAGCIQPTPPATQNIKVIMPFVASSEWMPVYAAINEGYYAEEDLNVSIEYTAEGSFGAIKQVAAGNSQFGYASGDSVILARSQDIPVISVYQVDHNDVFGILTKQSSGIKTPQDMVGKSVAIPGPGTPADIAIKAILTNSGVDYKTVTFIPVGSALIPALLSNQTDATSTWVVFEELLKIQGVPYYSMTANEYGANFVTDTLVTSESYAKNNPEVVKKFVRATDKGLKYAVANPETAVNNYIKDFNPEATKDAAFELACWNRFVNDAIAPNQYVPGSINSTQWSMTQDAMFSMGILDKKIDITQAYTMKFLP